MPKPAQGQLPPAIVKAYNDGYHDGYTKQAPSPDKYGQHQEMYARAWLTGREDRNEDEQAIEAGEFDLLTVEERRELYGDEDRFADYRNDSQVDGTLDQG